MSSRLRLATWAVLTAGLAAAMTGCSRGTDGTSVQPAAGTPVSNGGVPAAPIVASADPSKTGQAYVDELKQNPTLFEKQKEICHGHGAESQPSKELEGPCAAWDSARTDLELDQGHREGGVKNTDSL